MIRENRQGQRYAFWLDSSGSLFSQHNRSEIPGFHARSGQFLLGFDACDYSWGSWGISTGYAYVPFTSRQQRGHGSLNLCLLASYVEFDLGPSYLEIGFLGGASQTRNHRDIRLPDSKTTASSSYWGGMIAPHIGAGYDWVRGNSIFEPYFSLDWLYSWDHNIRERGSPFAMHMKWDASILRSEAGISIYQSWIYGSWSGSIREKVAYVNREFLNAQHLKASLVGISPTFVMNYPLLNQSLGNWGLDALFRHKSGFFMDICYDGEAGSGYLTHQLHLTLGGYF